MNSSNYPRTRRRERREQRRLPSLIRLNPHFNRFSVKRTLLLMLNRRVIRRLHGRIVRLNRRVSVRSSVKRRYSSSRSNSRNHHSNSRWTRDQPFVTRTHPRNRTSDPGARRLSRHYRQVSRRPRRRTRDRTRRRNLTRTMFRRGSSRKGKRSRVAGGEGGQRMYARGHGSRRGNNGATNHHRQHSAPLLRGDSPFRQS